jgi:hypothetical protein
MLVYHIGEVFPHPELKQVGFDAPRAMIIPNGFFNIVLHSSQPQLDKGLASTAMHVGIYQKDAIPFVLLNWPGKMAFEVILNIHTLTDEHADAWLNGSGNTIIFFVLDAHTNVIAAMKTFTIPRYWRRKFGTVWRSRTGSITTRLKLMCAWKRS